jgi:hypothetical protein
MFTLAIVGLTIVVLGLGTVAYAAYLTYEDRDD